MVEGNAAYLKMSAVVDREDEDIAALGGVLPYNVYVEDDAGNVSEPEPVGVWGGERGVRGGGGVDLPTNIGITIRGGGVGG